MAPLPVVLIVVSCFAHAAWNLLARSRRGHELAFFRRMLILVVPVSLVAGSVGMLLPHHLPPKALLCVLASGFMAGLYYWFLGLAYSASDFTIVYPVARALPVLIVAGLDLFRGRQPTSIGWGALVLVVVGCALAPQASYRGFDVKRYAARDIAWVVLTAATIVGFTMFDKIAAESVKPGPGSALVYCAIFQILSCGAYLSVHTALNRAPPGDAEANWRLPAAAAVLGFTSYGLTLWAYQLATHTAYLLALRQFSIVIGVAAAFGIYREGGLAVRLPATAAIVGGIVALVLYG